MAFLTTLWLPIVLSAVLVFIASSIIWAALQLHKNDYTQTPHDAAFQAVLRDNAMGPGLYCIPSRHDGETPAAYQERFTKGPCALLAVPSGPFNFGKTLGLWFLNQLVLAALIAYVAHAAIPTGDSAPSYFAVFRVVGAVALLAHAGMAANDTLWRFLGWRHAASSLFDGVVYAALTAGCFAGLWPR
ncbi:MAG: hypothetical protein HRU70_03505 [Phycisphaeraceae bacterium]|nr:MAG: hypothetical protein HRU70_03505 [Phycisphaeraceae bacterium]